MAKKEHMAPGVDSTNVGKSTDEEPKPAEGQVLTPSAEVAAAMRDIRKVQKKREAREEAIAELLTPDPDAVDDITASSEPKAEDINPGFTIMDIAGVKQWFEHHVQWLRDRGATVNGPVVSAVKVKGGTSGVTRETFAPDSPESRARDQDMTVFEGVFKWQYKDLAEGGTEPKSSKSDDPAEQAVAMEKRSEWQAKQAPQLNVTVVQYTEIDAWRDLAQQVLARRYEV